MIEESNSATGATTVVIVPATRKDEGDVIAKLREFAWDEPPLRVARIGLDSLAVDLAEPADDATVSRLQAALGRPTRRTKPPCAVWCSLRVCDEDG